MNKERGIIHKWNEDKGYGFIRTVPGSADCFVHIKDFPFYQRRPRQNDRLSFSVVVDAEGRRRAQAPRLLGPSASSGIVALIAFWLSVVLFAWWIYSTQPALDLLHGVAGLYLAACATTYTAYLIDKHRATTGGWRIPENVLHLLELAGGWPAAILAQRMLRHKVRKLSYQLIFWLIVALHVAAWAHQLWLPQLINFGNTGG